MMLQAGWAVVDPCWVPNGKSYQCPEREVLSGQGPLHTREKENPGGIKVQFFLK